jgi:hypothetical protein
MELETIKTEIKQKKKRDKKQKSDFEKTLNILAEEIINIYASLNKINGMIEPVFNKSNALEKIIIKGILISLGDILVEIGTELVG